MPLLTVRQQQSRIKHVIAGAAWTASNGVSRHVGAAYIVQQVRGVQRNLAKASTESLLPPKAGKGTRPKFAKPNSKKVVAHRTYYQEVLLDDIKLKPRASEPAESDWWFECRNRLGDIPAPHGSVTKVFWNLLQLGCAAAMGEGMDPKEEASARMICASKKLPGYIAIYRTMHEQADALYILGRNELERKPRFRKIAWFMLSVAAEMGQLDAAILLHRLERVDALSTAGVRARSIIQCAAEEDSNWQAIMAYVEHKVLDKPGMKRSPQSTAQALVLLRHLVFKKRPPVAELTGGPDLEPVIHPDALEEFVPPCRYLWKLIKSEHDNLLPYLESEGMSIDRFWADYAAALYEDATKHRNPKAMYEVTKLPQRLGYTESQPGTPKRRIMLTSASPVVAEACYTLGKEMSEEARLIPTRKELARSTDSLSNTESSPNEEQEKAILQVTQTAKMYHGKDCMVEAYLYLLAAGLYHDNNMFARGRETLELAIPQLRDTIEVTNDHTSTTIELFEGLLQRWDSYRHKGLYDSVGPRNIMVQLDQMILEAETAK